jgi:hypothetical protein
MLLSIIIPAYNEAEGLPTLTDQTSKILEDMAARDRCRPRDGIWKSSTAAAGWTCLYVVAGLNKVEIGETLAQRGLVAESSHRATALRDRSTPVGIQV